MFGLRISLASFCKQTLLLVILNLRRLLFRMLVQTRPQESVVYPVHRQKITRLTEVTHALGVLRKMLHLTPLLAAGPVRALGIAASLSGSLD